MCTQATYILHPIAGRLEYCSLVVQNFMSLPIVAIIGRPNVGKSTLVNRLAGARESIVHDEPGVTRDRTYRRAFWQDREFVVVDTGVDSYLTMIRNFCRLIREQAMTALYPG